MCGPLDVPDAAIGDSGATIPGCYACFEVRCMSQFAACNADCACAKSLYGFSECVNAGGSALNCGAMFMMGSPNAALLANCAASNCQLQCGL
jgi:hypothetical protein